LIGIIKAQDETITETQYFQRSTFGFRICRSETIWKKSYWAYIL